jgi:hypothetical protein
MRTLELLALGVIGCGGSPAPAPVAPPPPTAPSAPAETGSTQPDPSVHRFATIVPAGTVPAMLWKDESGEGTLIAAPTTSPQRFAIALSPTGACKGACAYYEHPIPAGNQRAPSRGFQPYGPDRQFAAMWGNPESGPFGVLVQIKAGAAPFWHMHGHDVRMVVLAGTVEYVESGQAKHTLAPGSYVQQSGGYKHTEGCSPGADCVLYVHGERGFDVKPM